MTHKGIMAESNPSIRSKEVFCILAAGMGGRLEGLTSEINKALLPIGNKPVISYIIDKIPEDMDIIMSVGYQKDSLIEFCQAAYPERNFVFVDVDGFNTKETGPATGVWVCREYLQRPFYFCTNDCIVDEEYPDLSDNWIGVYPTSSPEIYSTATIDEQGNVSDFVNKSENGYDLAFIGVAGFKDYQTFWDILDETYPTDKEIVAVFYHHDKFNPLKTKTFTWHDTGNIEAYEETVSKLCQDRANIKKKLTNART